MYLTEEMVPLSPFSEIVPAQERHALAQRLLELKADQAVVTPCNWYGTGFGKHRFPKNVTQTTTIADLAGKGSWFTMNILQITDQFLIDDVDTWPQSQAYQSSREMFLPSMWWMQWLSWGVHSVRLHPRGSKRGAKKEGRKRKKQGKGQKKRERKGAPKKERREGKENMQQKRKRGKKSKENRI